MALFLKYSYASQTQYGLRLKQSLFLESHCFDNQLPQFHHEGGLIGWPKIGSDRTPMEG